MGGVGITHFTANSTRRYSGVADNKSTKLIAAHRQARHEYYVLESFEAGIELCGTEVKSLREGRVNLKDSYCSVKDGEVFAYNMHISAYEKGNIFNRDPLRPKKLLLHKKEIMRLVGQLSQKGLALVPLSLYFKGPRVKMELGLCKGKKLYDKRETDAKRQAARDIDRAMKEH